MRNLFELLDIDSTDARWRRSMQKALMPRFHFLGAQRIRWAILRYYTALPASNIQPIVYIGRIWVD